jgi:hypothetical protein
VVEPGSGDVLAGRAFLVRIDRDPVLEAHVDHVDVEYTVGPFRFVTSASSATGTSITFCPPERPVADDGCVARP